jgi:hypothetical protein
MIPRPATKGLQCGVWEDREKSEMSNKACLKICGWICLIGVVNFATFLVLYFLLGGDAVHGGSTGEHYYLADHGQSTEVSYGTWLYSLIHAYSVLITIPLAIAAGIVGSRIRNRLRAG